MNEITKAQEDVLKAIWEVENGAVSDIMEKMPDPKPAYTTVATVIKVLERKGYVAHKTYGKTHVYHALVNRKEYANHIVREAYTGFFNSSLNQLVSPFIKNKDISLTELEELKRMLESEIEKHRR
jgi:predicted transcriptional regulator